MDMYLADKQRYEQMSYRRCGKSGLLLPAISLGLWHNFGSVDVFEQFKQIAFRAFDQGITHFDLANNYGPVYGSAEENFGRILRKGLGAYRDELLISTKAGYDMWPGPYGNWGSRKYLMASLDQSLKRMGLEYVDIFYHHRPDPETPLEETMGALAQAVQSGKALYVGLSNYDGATMQQACAILKELHCPFVINQNCYSMLNRTIEQNGLLDACAEEQKGLIVFSPLAQGLLTDRYLHGIPADSRMRTDGRFLNEKQLTPERLQLLQKLQVAAQARGEKLAQLAMHWILRQPAVTSVLIGASKPEQVQDALEMVQQAPLTDADIQEIEQILKAN